MIHVIRSEIAQTFADKIAQGPQIIVAYFVVVFSKFLFSSSSSFFFFFFFSTRLQPRVGHNKRGERERNVNDLQSDVEPPRVVTSGAAGAQVSPEVVLRANGNGKSEHGLRRGPEGGNVPERREEEERLLGINFHRTRHDCVINNVNNVPS